MVKVSALPRSEIAQRAAHFRALAARALRTMADKVEPVATQSIIVRTKPDGTQGYLVYHYTNSSTS